MKDSLIRSIKQFLHNHFVPGKPVLLAFSGGNDSLALLDLLCHMRPFFLIQLHIAHVDHGWRKESAKQAAELKQFCNTLGLTFHLHTSPLLEKSEERAREERLLFFRKLYKELDAQGLILAHHADDQAETVLKRIFEGAHMTLLGAMRQVAQYEEMTLWRPLLDIPKKKLRAWNAKRKLNPIQDETNLDERCLRGKMRQQIFPELSAQFGKEIAGNLAFLSQTAHELHDYLMRKTAPLLALRTQRIWDFTPFFPLEKIEAHFALKQLLGEQGIYFSRRVLQQMVAHLEKKSVKRCFGNRVIVDCGVIEIKNRD